MTRLLSARAIPAPLHRWMLRGAHRLRIAWWGWRRPVVEGVSIIARSRSGGVVLVRQSYGRDYWTLPGGGLGQGEDPAIAAAREFREELGSPLRDMELLATRDEPLHGATNRVHVFTASLVDEPEPDGREVIAAGIFDLQALPANLGPRARERLELLKDHLSRKGREG